jgi:hypothetical protein
MEMKGVFKNEEIGVACVWMCERRGGRCSLNPIWE